MFKLAVFAAIVAVALAAPGGLTGVAISSGLGPISAPAVLAAGHAAPVSVIAAAPAHAAPVAVLAAAPVAHATVIAQPIAPAVHSPPVVTRTVLAGHGAPLALHG